MKRIGVFWVLFFLTSTFVWGAATSSFTQKEIKTLKNVAAAGGSAQGLDQNFDIAPEIDGATSANPLIVGNGTQKGKLYGDPTKGFVIEPSPLGDATWRCWTNFNCVIRDEENSTNILVIDPDAFSTGSGTVTLQTGEQLVTSNFGVEFNESDTNPTCASGNYTIYADTSEAKLKKCQNGTATDLDTAGTGGQTLVEKTSDETVNNSATRQADDVLLFPIGTSGFTKFSVFVNYESSSVADFQFDFTVPASATGRWRIAAPAASASSCTTSYNSSSNTITTSYNSIGGFGAATPCSIVIDGYVKSGGTSGNVTFRWAQATLEASDTKVLAGSHLVYQTF